MTDYQFAAVKAVQKSRRVLPETDELFAAVKAVQKIRISRVF